MFGKKFRKILTNYGKDYKLLYDMIPSRRKMSTKNSNAVQGLISEVKKKAAAVFFCYRPPTNIADFEASPN